ncbi:MAG TPA: hypothetical protein ENK85_01810, partial [Saprospiraceae bacterium]|nr:hypothetical protein [Saprospiraceae bacterium]
MFKYFAFFLFFFGCFFAQAQQEVSLPMMLDIPNSVRFNPAWTTGYKWTVSLPSISQNFSSNGPSVDQLFEDNGNGNYILHVDQAVAQLKEDNLISNITKIEVLGLSHQWKKSFFHINFGVRTNVGVSFKKALAELAAFGNGPYVGQTLEIGPSIDAQAFTEIGVGYSHQIGSLRVGATVKFLNGLASATTTKSKISVYTDPEYYQLTATSDYELQSSSFISLDSLGKINLSPENFTPQMALKNGGTAFDLGLDYKITDRLSVSASAIDLGSILWKENAQTLTSKGSFTYDGLAADGGLSAIDSTSLTDLVDSVQNIFNFSQKTGEFKTP